MLHFHCLWHFKKLGQNMTKTVPSSCCYKKYRAENGMGSQNIGT